MERKLIESKIFDLQDKVEICEIALNEVNDCDELEPAYKDIIKAYREHIADLEEFLKLLPIQRVSEHFSSAIAEMESEILANLSDLDSGYGRRKWVISKQTGIPLDVLTVLLKRLKLAGKVELIMIWSENTGLPDGSGYCLHEGLNAR